MDLFKGLGSELGILNLVIWVIIATIVALNKMGLLRKFSPKAGLITGKLTVNNSTDKPGKADPCIEHDKLIDGLKIEFDNFMKQNEKDHNRMEKSNTKSHDKLFELLDKMRNGG